MSSDLVTVRREDLRELVLMKLAIDDMGYDEYEVVEMMAEKPEIDAEVSGWIFRLEHAAGVAGR